MEKYLPDSAYVIALAIEGKKLTSEKLAEKIDTLGITGTSHLVFLIGGSFRYERPSPQTGRLPLKLLRYDLPPPAHACDPSGTESGTGSSTENPIINRKTKGAFRRLLKCIGVTI